MSEVPNLTPTQMLELYIGIAYFVALFLYALYQGLKNRGKMQIMLQIPGGEKEYWRKKEIDGKTVVMEKKSKKNAGWEFKIENANSIKDKKRFFGLIHYQSVDIFPNAKEPIIFDANVKPEDQPKWTKKQSKEFIEAEVLKQRGRALESKGFPMWAWIIILLQIGTVAFIYLVNSGHLRLG
jgi:hypothetical protein